MFLHRYYSLLDTHCTTPIKYLYTSKQLCESTGGDSGLYVMESCATTQFYADNTCSSIIQSLPTAFKSCSLDTISGLYLSTACNVPVSSSSSSSSTTVDPNAISLPVVGGLAACVVVILVVLASVYYLLFRLHKEHINAPVTFEHIYKQQEKDRKRNANNGRNNTDADEASVASSARSAVPADQRIVNPLVQKPSQNRSPRIDKPVSGAGGGVVANNKEVVNGTETNRVGEGKSKGEVGNSAAPAVETVDAPAPDSARLSDLTLQTVTAAEPSPKATAKSTVKPKSHASPSTSAIAAKKVKKVKGSAEAAKSNGKKKGAAGQSRQQSNPQSMSPAPPIYQIDPRVGDDRYYSSSLPYPASAVDDYRTQRQYYPSPDSYATADRGHYPSSEDFYQYPAPSTQPYTSESNSGFPPFQPHR